MTLRETVLQEALIIFHRDGLGEITEASAPRKLNIAPATFQELFTGMEDMVNQAVKYDLKVQVDEHNVMLANSPDAVESIMRLLQHGISQVKRVNPLYYLQLQQQYPGAWQIGLDHLASYSYPQIHSIINQGVLEGNFRRDINLELVTKIIMEQLNMLLNPALFPPDRYSLAEVFRSIYLYYLRGLCTDAGAKLAEDFFAHNNL